MSDVRRWLDSLADGADDEADETSIFVQLDALGAERRERHDPHWFPDGPDPDGLEALVRDRKRRGVLRPPPGRKEHAR